MFGKKEINASSLTSSIDNIVSAFTTAVEGLNQVIQDATVKEEEHIQQIKSLEAEMNALNETRTRAYSIKEKLSALLQ